MQKIKSKVTIILPGGIIIKCKPEQVNEIIKNYHLTPVLPYPPYDNSPWKFDWNFPKIMC